MYQDKKGQPEEVLRSIGEMFLQQSELYAEEYIEYDGWNNEKKEAWERGINNIVQQIAGGRAEVSFTDTVDGSLFERRELYYDILNETYIIL